MSFTELLDELMEAGRKLSSTSADDAATAASSDARNQVNAALLPVWQWLDGLQAAAKQTGVSWMELDRAPSPDLIQAVKGAIAIVITEIDSDDATTLEGELKLLRSLLQKLADETDTRLDEMGVDPNQRNRLLLPLRAHISELALSRESSEALSLARKSLGQVGEKRLSKGVADQVEYERTRADWFRYGALLAFVLSIGWLVASYVTFRSSELAPGEERITQAVTRLAIGSALLILALYLSREATQHRSRANGWRSVELQMDTIDLYCASLPPEHRDAIRLSFGLEVFSGWRLFSTLERPGGGSADGTSPGLAGPDIDRTVALAHVLSRARSTP